MKAGPMLQARWSSRQYEKFSAANMLHCSSLYALNPKTTEEALVFKDP